MSRPRPVRRVAGRGRGTGATADKSPLVAHGRKTVASTARACAARAVRRKGSSQSKDRKRPSKQRKTSPGATKLRRASARWHREDNLLPARVTPAARRSAAATEPIAAPDSVSDAAPQRGQFVEPDSISMSDGTTPHGRPAARHRLLDERPSFLRRGPKMVPLGVAAAAIVGASVITMTVLHGARGGSSPVGHVDPSLPAAPAPSAHVAPRTLGAAAGPTSKAGPTHCAGCASAPNPGPVLLGGDLPSSTPAGATATFGVASDVAPPLGGVGNTGAPSSSGSVTPSLTSSSARPTSASPRPSSARPTSTPTSKPPTTTPTTPHTTPATSPATTPPTTPTPTPTGTPTP